MTNKSTVVSCVLASLAGVCFITGMTLLTSEGSSANNGTYKEIVTDN